MAGLVDDFHAMMEAMEAELGTEFCENERKRLDEALSATFKRIIQDEEEQEFVDALSRKHVESAKEKKRGVDVSPILDGKIQFGLLFSRGTNNLQLLRTEWKGRLGLQRGRALTPEENNGVERTGIKRIKQLVAADEKVRDGTSADYNEKFFRPRYTNKDDYEWEPVRQR